MLSNPNGKCVGTPEQDKNLFRYPIGTAPGNVYHKEKTRLFAPGTIWYTIADEWMPRFMGALIFLFFLFSSFFLTFSILRLIYLDKLKPYKSKKLRDYGKDQHHYRNNSGDFRRVKRLRKTGKKGKRRSLDDESDIDFNDDKDIKSLVHPPGQKISFTAPPIPHPIIRKSVKDVYSDVMKLMEGKNQVGPAPQGARGKPAARIIPLGFYKKDRPALVNKSGGLWGWDKKWYPRQLVDEGKTADAVERLHSTRSMLYETASEVVQSRHASPPSPPKTPHTPPLETITDVKKEEELKSDEDEFNPILAVYDSFLRARSKSLKQSSQATTPIQEDVDQQVVEPSGQKPRRTSRTKKRGKGGRRRSSGKGRSMPKPMFEPPAPPVSPSRVDHRELISRYTFLPDKSIVHTAIPKVEKPTYQQKLMILRAGPRRQASDIREIREKRKSSGAGSGVEEKPEGKGDNA